MLRLVAIAFVLLAPLASRAALVEISLAGFGLECSGGLACTGGATSFSLGGTLQGDLGADQAIANISGAISFRVIGTGASGAFAVSGGAIDLDGDGDAGGITSFFQLADGRTLSFADQQILGPANSFDGTNLYLIGTTWTQGSTAAPEGRWLAVGLAGQVRPLQLSGGSTAIPEPTSFALLAAGGLLIGSAVRRRI
jgi:hypothetical protein